MKRFLLLFLSASTVLSVILPIVTTATPALAAESLEKKVNFALTLITD